MSEYTPVTEEVRDRYAYDAEEHTPYLSIEKAHAQFDRWLATHDKQTRADERRRVAEEIRVEMRRHDNAQVGFSAVGDAYANAARIAEGDNR